MHIESKRLILRDFLASDGKELFEYLSDADVVCYEPYGPYTQEAADKEAASRAEDEAFIAVCLRKNGRLIGNLYFSKTDPEFINTYEIGYVFNKHFHGSGYATEAAKKLLEYLFSTLNAHRIVAYCNPENVPSWRLLERIGFRREAEQKENMFFMRDAEGEPLWFDSYQYAILQKEYKSIKSIV